jgi:cell division protein FtsB
MKKRFFTGIEIALTVALLTSLGLGFKNFKDRKKIQQLSETNTEQAEELSDLTEKVELLNNQKDNIVEKKDRVNAELKKEAGKGFSVLYEQSLDVHAENPTNMTQEHIDTAQAYVKVWGYDAMAKVIKWQQAQITATLQRTEQLMKEKEKLQQEYLLYKERRVCYYNRVVE